MVLVVGTSRRPLHLVVLLSLLFLNRCAAFMGPGYAPRHVAVQPSIRTLLFLETPDADLTSGVSDPMVVTKQDANSTTLFVDASVADPLAAYNTSRVSTTKKYAEQDPFQAGFPEREEKIATTLGGGTSLMFEMIRKRMLDWGSRPAPERNILNLSSDTPPAPATSRWHPYSGISQDNPSFRTQAPAMTNSGFAKSIWRNVRKRNKPSLWRNALRTYDRMTILEQKSDLKIVRSNSHYEGAMLACAKLGLWQRALELYHSVYQVEQDTQAEINRMEQSSSKTPTRSAIRSGSSPSDVASDASKISTIKARIRRQVHVTDYMILSLVRACVRASFQRSKIHNKIVQEGRPLSLEQEEQDAALRRIPLDTALEVLSTLKETHGISPVARHVNPLAAAYQSLGYIAESQEILQTMLSNRTAGEEPEDGVDVLNVYDLCAKDKGSYSLLVQGAVVTGDWGSAIEALSDMTNAGLYPNRRHCNVWSEVSERHSRPRAVGSWKKKRDDFWTDSVRYGG